MVSAVEYLLADDPTPTPTGGGLRSSGGADPFSNGRAQQAFQFFRDKGLADHHAAAVVGNFLQENGQLDPAKVNPRSGATGVGQWLGSRKHGLPADFEGQLDHAWRELNGPERPALDALLQTQTLPEATVSFRRRFERPGEAEANDAKRIGYAERVLNFLIPAANADETPPSLPSARDFLLADEVPSAPASAPPPARLPAAPAEAPPELPSARDFLLADDAESTPQPAAEVPPLAPVAAGGPSAVAGPDRAAMPVDPESLALAVPPTPPSATRLLLPRTAADLPPPPFQGVRQAAGISTDTDLAAVAAQPRVRLPSAVVRDLEAGQPGFSPAEFQGVLQGLRQGQFDKPKEARNLFAGLVPMDSLRALDDAIAAHEAEREQLNDPGNAVTEAIPGGRPGMALVRQGIDAATLGLAHAQPEPTGNRDIDRLLRAEQQGGAAVKQKIKELFPVASGAAELAGSALPYVGAAKLLRGARLALGLPAVAPGAEGAIAEGAQLGAALEPLRRPEGQENMTTGQEIQARALQAGIGVATGALLDFGVMSAGDFASTLAGAMRDKAVRNALVNEARQAGFDSPEAYISSLTDIIDTPDGPVIRARRDVIEQLPGEQADVQRNDTGSAASQADQANRMVEKPDAVEPAGRTDGGAVQPLEKPAGEAQALPAQNRETGLTVVEAPIDRLKLSVDVPQFKVGADEAGVVEPLGGRFDRTGVAPIQVWERTNGDLEVISGRHRLDLARRSGETTIPAQIHREADGFDVIKAARLDAELNIRDGQGAISDYANYFRHSDHTEETADTAGLLARAKGRAGFRIALESGDTLFDAHQSGRISDDRALAILDGAGPDESLQNLGLKLAQEGRAPELISNTLKAVSLMAREKGGDGQADLFGFDDSAIKAAVEMATKAAAEQKSIRANLNAIKGAARKPEVARKFGIDVNDPASALARTREMQAELKRWENWPAHSDLVAKVRGQEDVLDTAGRGGPEETGQALSPVDENQPNLFGEDEQYTAAASGAVPGTNTANATNEGVKPEPKGQLGLPGLEPRNEAKQAVADLLRQKDAKRQGAAVDAGFDGGLFSEGRTRQTDIGDVSYSKHSVLSEHENPKGISHDEASQAVNEFRTHLSGASGIDFRIFPDLESAFGPNHGITGRVKGFYLPKQHIVGLFRNTHLSMHDALQTLRHETIAHYGLNILEPSAKRDILERIAGSRNDPFLKGIFEQVEADYPEHIGNALFQAEEAFARIAEREDDVSARPWLDRIMAWVAQGLRRVGFIQGRIMPYELRDLARSIAEGIRRNAPQRTFPKDNQSQFSRLENPASPGDRSAESLENSHGERQGQEERRRQEARLLNDGESAGGAMPSVEAPKKGYQVRRLDDKTNDLFGESQGDKPLLVDLDRYVSIHAPEGANLEEVTPLPNKFYPPEGRGFKPAAATGRGGNPRPLPSGKVQTFGQRVGHRAVSELRTGLGEIHSPEDAAHVLGGIRKQAQEHVAVVVTDDAGKVRRAFVHTVGGTAKADVDPAILAGMVVNTPGGARAWVAHNHPSGKLGHSEADAGITRRLMDLLSGSGVELQGHLVLAQNQRMASIDTGRGYTQLVDITPAPRRAALPLLGRELRGGVRTDPIDNPLEMARAVKDLVPADDAGVLLLDSQNRPVGWLAMTSAEMRQLRQGAGGPLARLLGAVEATNASRFTARLDIPLDSREAADTVANLHQFGEAANVKPLDVAAPNGSLWSTRFGDLQGDGRATFYSNPFLLGASALAKDVGLDIKRNPGRAALQTGVGMAVGGLNSDDEPGSAKWWLDVAVGGVAAKALATRLPALIKAMDELPFLGRGPKELRDLKRKQQLMRAIVDRQTAEVGKFLRDQFTPEERATMADLIETRGIVRDFNLVHRQAEQLDSFISDAGERMKALGMLPADLETGGYLHRYYDKHLETSAILTSSRPWKEKLMGTYTLARGTEDPFNREYFSPGATGILREFEGIQAEIKAAESDIADWTRKLAKASRKPNRDMLLDEFRDNIEAAKERLADAEGRLKEVQKQPFAEFVGVENGQPKSYLFAEDEVGLVDTGSKPTMAYRPTDRADWTAATRFVDVSTLSPTEREWTLRGVNDKQAVLHRDWTEAERAAWGEIKDAGYRYVRGMAEVSHDLSLATLFEAVSKRADWVSDTPREGWAEVPTTKAGSGSPLRKYGALAGKYVKPDIWAGLQHHGRSPLGNHPLVKIYRGALNKWKLWHTADNPVTHFNNLFSNTEMLFLAGYGPKDLAEAIRHMRQGEASPLWIEARDQGLFGTDWTASILADESGTAKGLSDLAEELRTQPDVPDATLVTAKLMDLKRWWLESRQAVQDAKGALGTGTALIRAMNAPVKLATKPYGAYSAMMRRAYSWEDNLFKLAVYSAERRAGRSPDEAVTRAGDFFFDYYDVPDVVRWARDLPIGSPFIAYTYLGMQAMAKNLVEHPGRMLGLLAGFEALNYAVVAATGDGAAPDEYWALDRAEEAVSSPWDRGRSMIGLRNMLHLPAPEGYRLALGRSHAMGNPFASEAEGGQGLLGAWGPDFFGSNPFMRLALALNDNKDWKGKPIYEEKDPDEVKARKVANYLYQGLTPSTPVFPGSYHQQKILEGLANDAARARAEGRNAVVVPIVDGANRMLEALGMGQITGQDRQGNPIETRDALLGSVGIKLRPARFDQGLDYGLGQLQRERREVATRWRKERDKFAQGRITQAGMDEANSVRDADMADIAAREDKLFRAMDVLRRRGK